MQTEQRITADRGALARFGGRPALVTPDETITYGELDDRVADVAAELGPARRLVLLEARTTPAAVVGLLASLRGGHAVMLVPPGDTPLGRRLLEEYEPDVVVAGGPPGAEVPVVVQRWEGSRHEIHPELALLLATSGTTGSPRLVRLSKANVTANASAIASYLRLSDADVALTALPLHYCYGLSVLTTHLHVGAAVVLTDASVLDPCFWAQLADHGVTNFAGVPHTFDLLDRVGFDTMDIPSLRFVTQAGGRMHPEKVRRYAQLGQRNGWELFVMYGQTEATARMAYLPPELAAFRPHCIGVAVPGGSFRIDPLDEPGHGDGAGELVYRGPNVMLGYADAPADLALGGTVDELRTGDIARRHDDGLFEIIGRRSRFVKLFGLRIDLDAVERSLRDGGIAACCAGDDDGLVVATTTGTTIDVGRRVSETLGLPRAATAVVEVDEMPLLANGKVDYRRILELRGDVLAPPVELPRGRRAIGGRAGSEVPPASGADAVRTLYARLLDVPIEAVIDDATFVSLGGDSLTYVEMSMHLERRVGELPPHWQRRTVAELGAGAKAPRRRRALDTTVLLRGVAILAVVASHASSLSIRGGAHLLLAVSGFNVARFQLSQHGAAHRSAALLRSAARVAVPSIVCIAAFQLLVGTFQPSALLLVSNLAGGASGRGSWRFWYIDVLVQLLVVAGVAFASARVRRLERHRPALFAWGVLAGTLLLRYDLLDLPDGAHPRFQPHNVAWLFALGWVAERATTTWERLLVSLVAGIGLISYFDRPAAGAFVFGGFLLLTWWRSVSIPRPLHRLLGTVAGASLFIYLLHWHVLRVAPDVPSYLVVAGGVLAGVVAAEASRRLSGLLRRRRWAASPPARQEAR